MGWKHIKHVLPAAAALMAMAITPMPAQALSNNAQVPVLYYHSHQAGGAGVHSADHDNSNIQAASGTMTSTP